MTAYYNEFDPYAAQWLRNLIAKNLIAPGDVDERSIVDVQPDDLKGYTQCHFFAGIGGWSYAARLSGWPDDRSMWSASCPCQPYSLAGKGLGQEDERDLWPVLDRLIAAIRPPVIVGEQVKDAIGKHWLDRMRFDLEKSGYTLGATVLPACAVDAPHRRDRLWFVAESDSGMCDGRTIIQERRQKRGAAFRGIGEGYRGGDVADPQSIGGRPGLREGNEIENRDGFTCGSRADDDVDNSVSAGPQGFTGDVSIGHKPRWIETIEAGSVAEASCAIPYASEERCDGWGEASEQEARPNARIIGRNSTAWSGSEWAIGSDGKARRVEPGIRLLAHGVPARVGKLRAYGNAIVPQVAAEVIGAYMEIGILPYERRETA